MDQNSQSFTPPSQVNPLTKHFRQPAIYLKLPSNGAYWPDGAINLSVTGEIPVLPMSTRDEIVLKTPDALLNGQGVVNVLQSCCPSIKDAWLMPSIDVDAAIIAIRIASYGNQMDFTSECPHCNAANDYAIDLGVVLSNIRAPDYTQKVILDNLTIKLKPQPYFSVNRSNMIAYEEQQMLRSISALEDDNVQEAKEIFNKQLDKLVALNILIISDSTDYIETEEGTIVNDPNFIYEFYSNCDTKVIKRVQAQLEEFTKAGGVKPVTTACKNEECGKDFEVKLTFDFASFFAKGS